MPRWTIRIALLLWLSALPLSARVHGQAVQSALSTERSGAQIYQTACAACHAMDGTGAPQTLVGFDTPLPDFTDCGFASVEPYADWLAIVSEGGPVRGFDRHMPAFGGALTDEEIIRAIEHIHTLCDNPSWPPGDLNLPRPLVTEKAFPENETVLTMAVGGEDLGAATSEIIYEKRFGSRNQYEVVVPLALMQSTAGWDHGLGDVKIAVKRVLHHSLASGRILSGGGEVSLPTGKEALGLGKGVTILEPFLVGGQLLPRNSFLHAQAGVEIPTDRTLAEPEAFWRTAVGTTFEQGRFGRAWTPMMELLGAREFEDGQRVLWDVVPGMQVTLNKRQHLMISAGVRVPLNDRETRHPQFVSYFLWDWFDGGLRDGW